jgi:hypothetical protein
MSTSPTETGTIAERRTVLILRKHDCEEPIVSPSPSETSPGVSLPCRTQNHSAHLFLSFQGTRIDHPCPAIAAVKKIDREIRAAKRLIREAVLEMAKEDEGREQAVDAFARAVRRKDELVREREGLVVAGQTVARFWDRRG